LERVNDYRKLDRGASLLEFAILAPFLILLLFGIIEFSWLFATNLDVRHGAREAARQAATDDLSNPASPEIDICSMMDLANRTSTEVSISRSGIAIGQSITVTVDAAAETITGLLDWVIPSGTRLTSTVTLRLEQPPTWTPVGPVNCP
jgi:Flp pilus assembly protein TadG